MSSSPDSPTEHANLVRWHPLKSLPIFCELHSTDADVLHRAQLLFAPCLNEQTTATALNEPTEDCSFWRWKVERDEGNATLWRACNSDGGVEFTDRDVRRILAAIEDSTVQALVDVVKRNDTPLFAMHGALLCKQGFGLIVVGPSESGKSTLSCALWRSGWQLLCDDFCFLQNGNEALPALRRASLRHGSRALLGEELWLRLQNAPSSYPTEEGWIFHPHEVEATPLSSPVARGQAVRVNAIVFLGRDGISNSAAEVLPLQQINAARAALALLPYGTLLPCDGQPFDSTANRVLEWGAALPKIAPLVERAPVYSLKRDTLPQMIASVEALRLESARENL